MRGWRGCARCWRHWGRASDSAASFGYSADVTYHFDSQTFVRRMEAAGMARAVAKELAEALGFVVRDGFATMRDLTEGFDRSDNRLRETVKDVELRLTLRFGAMLVGSTALSVALLGALIALQ